MATQVRLRRGTTSELQSFTGAEGEVTVDTDKDVIVVHDGSTVGGHPHVKASQARGYVRKEHFLTNGTWTKIGKDDLKRIEVYAWGGGGGGGNNTSGGSGAGSGGHGYRVIEAADLTDNVSINIGAGGATGGSAGGNTSFGSYLSCNGGSGGVNNNYGSGGAGGTMDSDGVSIELGGFCGSGGGYSATANANFGWMGGTGGGFGGGGRDARQAGRGVRGGGGGTGTAPGADGSIEVYEIYGEV